MALVFAATFVRLALRTRAAIRVTFGRGRALHPRRVEGMTLRCRHTLHTRRAGRVTFGRRHVVLHLGRMLRAVFGHRPALDLRGVLRVAWPDPKQLTS